MLRLNLSISAAEIHQRIAIKDFRRFNLPDKNRVIARDERFYDPARNMYQRIIKQWNPRFRPAIANAQSRFHRFVFHGLCKIP